MPDRFGVASLRHTDGPRRLSDTGPVTSVAAWVCSWLLLGETDDECLVTALEAFYEGLAYVREPGELGLDDCRSEGRRLLLGLPYADTVDPDDDRILSVDDLAGFGKDD